MAYIEMLPKQSYISCRAFNWYELWVNQWRLNGFDFTYCIGMRIVIQKFYFGETLDKLRKVKQDLKDLKIFLV